MSNKNKTIETTDSPSGARQLAARLALAGTVAFGIGAGVNEIVNNGSEPVVPQGTNTEQVDNRNTPSATDSTTTTEKVDLAPAVSEVTNPDAMAIPPSTVQAPVSIIDAAVEVTNPDAMAIPPESPTTTNQVDN